MRPSGTPRTPRPTCSAVDLLMTPANARVVANVMVVTAGAVAAYTIVTRPALRRLTLLGLRWWLGASVPLYVMKEVSRAWAESAREGRRSAEAA